MKVSLSTNNRLRFCFSAVFLFGLSFFCLAQDFVRDVKAEGRWFVHRDITEQQAEERALMEAKKNAVEKSVGFEVNSIIFSNISGGEEGYQEFYSQINTLAINGLVVIKNSKVFSEVDPRTNEKTVVAQIVADVARPGRTDPSFFLTLEGIDSYYKEGTGLSFSVVPSQDAYIHLFWFDNTVEGKGAKLFPNASEHQRLFHKEETVVFPVSPDIAYTAELNDSSPRCMLAAVATRTESPFTSQEVTFASFIQWLYTIPPTDRTIPVWANFIIFK